MRAIRDHRALGRHGAAAAVVVASLLVAGCDPPSSAVDSVAVAAEVPAPAPASGVQLTGDVKNPRLLSLAELGKLKQHTVKGTFKTHHGTTSHTDVGPLLAKLITYEDLAITDRKNDQVSFTVVARAANGYSASFSFGEFAPDMGDGGIILSLVRDGKKLERPGIVVPGDASAFRHVHSIVELRVVRMT